MKPKRSRYWGRPGDACAFPGREGEGLVVSFGGLFFSGGKGCSLSVGGGGVSFVMDVVDVW